MRKLKNKLVSDRAYEGPNGPVLIKPPDVILPKGKRGSCHLHDKIVYFNTIDDLMAHMLKYHDYRKAR